MATMRRMIELGREAVMHGQADFGETVTERPGVPTDAKHTALTDTLANLMHWADSEQVNFGRCKAEAETHHRAEHGTALDAEPDA